MKQTNYTLDFMVMSGLNIIKTLSEQEKQDALCKLKIYNLEDDSYYKMGECLFKNIDKYINANDKYHLGDMIDLDFQGKKHDKEKKCETLANVFNIIYYLTRDNNVYFTTNSFTKEVTYHHRYEINIDEALSDIADEYKEIDEEFINIVNKCKLEKEDGLYIVEDIYKAALESLLDCRKRYENYMFDLDNILNDFLVMNNFRPKEYNVARHIGIILLKDIIYKIYDMIFKK